MTRAQQRLLDRLFMMCLASDGILTGTEEELYTRIHLPDLRHNLMSLIAAQRVLFSLHGEQWRIRLVRQEARL